MSLPKTIPSIHGPVKVLLEPPEDSDAVGEFSYVNRVIRIHPDVHPSLQWATLWHEVVHVALWDAGVHNILDHAVQEAVCDAVGNYMAHAKVGRG